MKPEPLEVVTTSRLFDGTSIRGGTAVTLRHGVIESIDGHDGPWDHHIVSPGFLDLQMNGYDTVNCAGTGPGIDRDSLAALDSTLFGRGTTKWFATLVTDDLDRVVSRTAAIEDSRDSAPGCVGVHLEGPFLGSRLGAHNPSRVLPPDQRFAHAPPSGTRMVTTGAEHPDSPGFIRELVGNAIVVSLGHTAPDRGQWDECVRSGASMVTHLFNAMPGVHHREDTMALLALVDERVRFGLIADLVHVSRDALALAFAAAPDRACLVSDSVAWNDTASQRAGIRLRDGAPRLPDGTLAGSSTTLAECVRNVVRHCGVDLAVALRAATVVPAGIVGMTDDVVPSPGRVANLVALDESLCVTAAWRALQSVRDLAPLS